MDRINDDDSGLFQSSIDERITKINETRNETLDYIKTQGGLFSKIDIHLQYTERMQELVGSGEWMQGLLHPLVCVYYEVEQSFYLSLEGFYKQALSGLRSALELTILFYFYAELISVEKVLGAGDVDTMVIVLENCIEDLKGMTKNQNKSFQNPKELDLIKQITNLIRDCKISKERFKVASKIVAAVQHLESIYGLWITSKRDTLLPGKLLRIMEKNQLFREFNAKFAFVDEINGSYRELSHYVHSRGKHYLIDNVNQHVNSFGEESFKEYLQHFFSVIRIIIKLSLIRSPEKRNPPPKEIIDLEEQNPDVVIFGYFNEYSIKQIQSILLADEFEFLYPEMKRK